MVAVVARKKKLWTAVMKGPRSLEKALGTRYMSTAPTWKGMATRMGHVKRSPAVIITRLSPA
ncbi:MAG: hypothetical protein U0324_08605 [Polyangiales bacterium]